MDIEILANRLLEYALNENATEYDRQVMADAVHELSRLLTEKNLAENRAERHKRDAVALKSENEVLRAEVEQERAHRIHAEQHADAFQKDCERLNAELERVKAERDGAVSDLETIMAYNSDTCQFCKNGQCYVRGGTKSCLPKWRGQKEE